MQTPKKFSSFSDQVSWISDEKGIKIKDREYAEELNKKADAMLEKYTKMADETFESVLGRLK